MTNSARANSSHVAVGLCILLLGVFLVLDRLGVIGAGETLRYWPLGLVIIGIGVIIQGFRGSAGPHATSSVPWGAIFLLVILGFGATRVFERRTSAERAGGDTLTLFAMMGGSERTANPGTKGASVTAVLGGANLDLRGIRPAPGEEIVVDILTVMGGSVIYAPVDWTLDVRAMAMLGGIADNRRDPVRPRRRRDRNNRDDNDEVNVEPGSRPEADAAGPPEAVTPVPVPEPAPSPVAQPDTAPVEADTPPSTSTPARLVIRGFVGLGGLAIKATDAQ